MRWAAQTAQTGLKCFLLWTAPRRTIGGVPVTVTTSDADQQASVYEKIAAALALLAQFHPRGYRAVRRYMKRVLVAWAPHVHGSWFGPLRLCELSLEFVTHARPSEIASTIVHEAMHARLERLGFDYNQPIRPRLESMCVRKEIEFVEKLPEASSLLDQLQHTLSQVAHIWSEVELHKARVSALHTLGAPRWLIRLVDRS